MSKASLPKKILNSPSVSKQADYVTNLLDKGDPAGGSADDKDAFINGLKDLDREGKKVPGWKSYNEDKPDDKGRSWSGLVRDGITQMQKDLPLYIKRRFRS